MRTSNPVSGLRLPAMLVCAFTICIVPFQAQAQTSPKVPPPNVLGQEEQRQRAEQRETRRITPPAPAPAAGPPAPETTSASAPGPCVRVRKLNLEGGPLLPQDMRQGLLKEFSGRCLTLREINEILRRITNWYVGQGYVTSGAWLPEQDVSKGVLTVKIVEGRTERVAITENGQARSGVDTAFPGGEGERLNIRGVEQGLDQINRLRSFNAKARLEPGKEAGGTTLAVDTARGRSWRVLTTLDNFGLPSTGKAQAGSIVEADDPLGLYDFLQVSVNENAGALPLAGTESQRLSRNASVFYEIPYGIWTASYYGAWFEYETPIASQSRTAASTGTTFTNRAEVNALLHRDQVSKTRLRA